MRTVRFIKNVGSNFEGRQVQFSDYQAEGYVKRGEAVYIDSFEGAVTKEVISEEPTKKRGKKSVEESTETEESK